MTIKIQCYSVQETPLISFLLLLLLLLLLSPLYFVFFLDSFQITMTEWREFRPQSNLLQSNFDGYRLSLDPLAQYSVKFDDSLLVQKEVEMNSDMYTYNAMKAFKSNNELYTNPWKNAQDLYFFDRSYAICSINVSASESLSHLQQPVRVYQLASHSLHGSMAFTSESTVVVCDGRSKLFILDTTTASKWKSVHEEDFDEYVSAPIRLIHAVFHENTVQALVGSLNNVGCQFLWITWTMESSSQWKLSRRRVLEGKKWPEMIVFESTGKGLYLVAEQGYKFTYDSLIEVIVIESMLFLLDSFFRSFRSKWNS